MNRYTKLAKQIAACRALASKIELPKYPAGGHVGHFAFESLSNHLSDATYQLKLLEEQLDEHEATMKGTKP